MAVSYPQVRIFVNGKRNAAHDALIPDAFRLVDQVKRDSSLLTPVTGSNVGVLGVQRKLRGGAKISVQKYGDWFMCYIDVPGEEGFYTEITEIYLTLSVFYDPVVCFDTKTNKPVDCDSEHYCIGSTADPSKCFAKRIFRETKVYKDKSAIVAEDVPQTYVTTSGVKYNGFDEADQIHINRLCSATTKTSTHGMGSDIHCYKAWSKTLDHVSAVAILYYDHWSMENIWCVMCDVDRKPYTFELGHIQSDHWPIGGYSDSFQVGGVDPYNTTPGYKGFDLWKEKKDIDGDKTKTYHYFLSMAADSYNQVDVWDLSATRPTKKWRAFRISSIGEFIEDNNLYFPYVPDGWEGRHIRFVGLSKKTYYWAVLDCHYGIASGQIPVSDGLGKVFWENDKESGYIVVDNTDYGFQLAILDEFKEEIVAMPKIYTQLDPEVQEPTRTEYVTQCNAYVTNTNSGVNVYQRQCDDSWHIPCEYIGHWIAANCSNIDESFPDGYMKWTAVTWKCENWNDWFQRHQVGLEPGEYKNISDLYTWVNQIVGSGTGNCDMSSCGRAGAWQSAVKYIWDHWALWASIDGAYVHPDYSLATHYTGQYKHGFIEGNWVINGWETYEDTTYTTQESDTYGKFEEKFSQPRWPYYPSYAIAKSTISCTEPISKEEIVRTKQTGEIVNFLTYEMDEDDLTSKCKLDMTNKNWSIIQDNTGKLHDTLGIINGKYAQFFFIGQSTETRTYVTDD